MRIFILLLFISCNTFAQEDNERWKLYPTENFNVFIKLDTWSGATWKIQKRTNDRDDRVVALTDAIAYSEAFIEAAKKPENNVDLSSAYEKFNQYNGYKFFLREKPGRFKLYPTTNMWTFLLQDTLFGDTYQLQWSADGEDDMLFLVGGETARPKSRFYIDIESFVN